MDRPLLPWLRYVDAADLDDPAVDFDGLNVESPTGEHLGTVDGFIADPEGARPYYVVVDAGGWFKSKHYLLPIGHARLDADREVLAADLTRDRIERFPGFDRSEFERLSVEELEQFNDATCMAGSLTDTRDLGDVDEPLATTWDRPDFRRPDWWRAVPPLPSDAGPQSATAGGAYDARPAAASRSAADAPPRAAGDPSPHYAGRAQPGDVIGVETGGERTYIGDTADDENRRREQAEADDRRRK